LVDVKQTDAAAEHRTKLHTSAQSKAKCSKMDSEGPPFSS